MAFIQKIALEAVEVTTQGTSQIQFIDSPVALELAEILYATEYYNKFLGTFDPNKTTICLKSGNTLLLNQSYLTTLGELTSIPA